MAKYDNDIGGRGEVYIGEDKSFAHEVLDADGVPVDITGWTVKMAVSLTKTSAALYTKTCTVAGSYSATRASNTQRATATFTDDELATLTKGQYFYSFKRDDSNSEVITSEGKLFIQRANQV